MTKTYSFIFVVAFIFITLYTNLSWGMDEDKEGNVSHSPPRQKTLSFLQQEQEKVADIFDITEWETRLKGAPTLILPLDETLHILRQLSQCGIGQFLLKNKGLDGYWTAYITQITPDQEYANEEERWLVCEAPIMKSGRERFGIFQQKTQKYLQNDMTLASLPCGLMDDLLSLDYSGLNGIKLVGIDKDQRSLKLAALNAERCNKGISTSFIERDAWDLGVFEEFDLITSNGLNIYAPNEEKVILLYKEFFKALRSGGTLITSFMTPPPALSNESSWRSMDPEAPKKLSAIAIDIVQGKWQFYQTEKQVRQHLAQAGFRIVEITDDIQGMFPTVVAKKD